MFDRVMNLVARLHRSQAGMTGLETAIILIAFVTVAAVFGYAVLSSGLFSAEREKETIYAGLDQVKSNLELSGSVIARGSGGNITQILLTVKNAIAGKPIEMNPCDGTSSATNKTVVSLSTSADYLSNLKFSVNKIGSNDGDNLLEVGEQFEIVLNTSDLGDGKLLSDNLTANDQFSIQVKPSMGSYITIMRTLPPQIDDVMDLH